MDTKWVVGAALAAFLAFGGATWWLTSDAASGPIPAPTAEISKSKTGKQDAKGRKHAGHGKARKGKAKSGKGGKVKGGKGKAKARDREQATDPAEAAAKWDAFRDIVAEGGHARVAEFGLGHEWDEAKIASVQKLLDDGIAQLDATAARLQSGEIDAEAAKEEVLAHRRDIQASLFTLIGEADARALVATMKPPAPGG